MALWGYPRTLSCTSRPCCSHPWWCQAEVEITDQPLQRWSAISRQCGEWVSLTKTLSAALGHANKHLFPNMKTLLSIICVLPVSTCSSERSNNTLKLVKDRLCSTMGNERLTGLILMSVHRDIEIDPQEVISEFARRQPRKLELMNIMSEC